MSDDLRALAVDIAALGPQAERESYKAVTVTAHKMRDDWRARVRGARALRGLEAALSYDIRPTGLREITAEVGYDQRGQGELGNIAEFGTSSTGPIRPAGETVLNAGADELTTYLARLGDL